MSPYATADPKRVKPKRHPENMQYGPELSSYILTEGLLSLEIYQ
jgi:hypothetical protein